MLNRYERYYKAWLDYPDELWVNTPSGFISHNTFLGPTGGPTELDDWQVYMMDNTHLYTVWAKTRQAGYSWTQAMLKLARAMTEPGYLGVFLSINLEEAKNKIMYMRAAYDTMRKHHQTGRYKLVKDSATELRWANGSRVVSLPAKPVRGYAKADITMDEAAHIPRAQAIYDGTTAASVRSESAGISLGSSPLGRDGLFADIWLDPTMSYKAFNKHRYTIYWWDVSGLCVDVKQARRTAKEEGWADNVDRAAVEARVLRFGTARLMDEFNSKRLEAFLQEYEIGFADSAFALIQQWALDQCTDPEYQGGFYAYYENPSIPFLEREVYPQIERAIALSSREHGVYAGYDVARTRNQSVLTLLAPQKLGDRWRWMLVGYLRFRSANFVTQQHLLDYLMNQARVRRLKIDATGLGMQLGEYLTQTHGSRVEPVSFTAPIKESLATGLAVAMEAGRLYMRADRDLRSQLYAVKKVATANGNLVYRAEDTDDNHADAFWSLALAAQDVPKDEVTTQSLGRILTVPRG